MGFSTFFERGIISVEFSGENMNFLWHFSRYERQSLPGTVVVPPKEGSLSKTPPSKVLPDESDLATCPPHLLPSKEWEEEILRTFSELREVLFQLTFYSLR